MNDDTMRPRGRPRGKPTTNPADRILDAAAESFATHGSRGASMRVIADAAGMRAPSIYNHFASKDELLIAVGKRYFAALVPQLQAASRMPGTGVVRLENLIRAATTVSMTHPFDHLTMVRELMQVRREPGAESLVADGQRCIAIWHMVIRRGQADGSLRGDVSPAGMTWLIFTAITALADPGRRADILGDPATRNVDTLCTVLIDGARPVSR
ncbi:TetR/AcrR family transcriptional regulator [Nocardioides sp. LHD-245]|uniref:TetR/AcrR family transcriptional regulator n=1 Tax=Nocardioides sp. LHD-245 TaxID=3051387 RepID=UPI0027E00B74|nr:TetR/AcrR family transcriptional regulator [Nocardioides sp. LHD-245]